MLRDITFGKYYSTDSLIHSLDARVKLFAFIAFVVTVFTIKHPIILALALVLTLIVLVLSNVPVSLVLNGLWNIKYYVVLCALLSVVSDFSVQGLVNAGLLSVKLILSVMFATLFTLTTSISHISDSIEWFLSPLQVIHVPVRDVAVMLSMALRFIPVLNEEARLIIQAQKARGAMFKKGSVLPLIIPIFESAIRRASDLSDALKARAYGAKTNRTRLYPLQFDTNDVFALMVFLLYLVAVIWGNAYAV